MKNKKGLIILMFALIAMLISMFGIVARVALLKFALLDICTLVITYTIIAIKIWKAKPNMKNGDVENASSDSE